MVEPHAFGNFDFVFDGSSFMVITHLSALSHSLENEAADVQVTVGGDGGDLSDFSGDGSGFGVGREECEDTVDGGLGTSEKISGFATGGKRVHTARRWWLVSSCAF